MMGREGNSPQPSLLSPSLSQLATPPPTHRATVATTRRFLRAKQVGVAKGGARNRVIPACYTDTAGFNIELTRSFVGMNLKSVTVCLGNTHTLQRVDNQLTIIRQFTSF